MYFGYPTSNLLAAEHQIEQNFFPLFPEKILFVYNPDLFKGLQGKNIRDLRYSQNDGDLKYKRNKQILTIKYKNQEFTVKIPKICMFMWELIPAAFAVGILEGVDLSILKANLSKFNFHPRQLCQGMKQLKRFLHGDGYE